MVEGEGFEPSKASPTDLQSVPFGHSGTPPKHINPVLSGLTILQLIKKPLFKSYHHCLLRSAMGGEEVSLYSTSGENHKAKKMELAMGLEPATC